MPGTGADGGAAPVLGGAGGAAPGRRAGSMSDEGNSGEAVAQDGRKKIQKRRNASQRSAPAN